MVTKYFQKVGSADGANKLRDNPCQLLDFMRILLPAGGSYEGDTAGHEALFVVLSGQARVRAAGADFPNVGGRANVFAGKPHAVYLPPRCRYQVDVPSGGPGFDAALAMAKAEDGSAPFHVEPDAIRSGKWGISNFSRTYHQILVHGQHPGHKVSRLIAGETFTPSGNWSTYPPHRHEKEDPPREAYMEEMYYFRIAPSDGWGLARYYTDDRRIDDAYTIEDNTILMMPNGYHTVTSTPGYTTYYLWFLAGNTRVQAAFEDPHLSWVGRTIPMIRNIEENLS